MIVATAYANVIRVVHVVRYADLEPMVEAELVGLERVEKSEMLNMSGAGLNR